MTIQRILCRIRGYDKYVKGQDLLIADALSRSQTTNQNRSKIEQEIERDQTSSRRSKLKTSYLAEISEATEQDTDLQFVIHRTDRFAGHYTNEMFVLKFYRVGVLNMNCHLAIES